MHNLTDSPRLTAIQVAIDVGRPPAVIVSLCGGCSVALTGYLTLNGLAVRVGEARGGVAVYVTDDAGAFAEAMLSAFRLWCSVALGLTRPDHLRARTTAGT